MVNSSLIVDRLLAEVHAFVPRRQGVTVVETPVSRLAVWSSASATAPSPIQFQPMFYAVLQGTKVLTLGENRFALTPGECAATSFGLPFVAQLEDASLDVPFVAIQLDLDVDLLVTVMLDMPKTDDRWVCSAAGGELHGPLADILIRFVGLASATEDQPMLERAYERELYYRLLQSPMGDTLRQLGQRDGRLRRIKQAADWLCANASQPVVISELAASAGMSLTSFHRHFKAVTGHSPLVFQRQMRLLRARRLLNAGGATVASVGCAVGYVSPSQFSREYKSMFGRPPASDLPKPARS